MRGHLKSGDRTFEVVPYSLASGASFVTVLGRRRINLKGLKDFHLKPGPKSGPGCLICAEFAGQLRSRDQI